MARVRQLVTTGLFGYLFCWFAIADAQLTHRYSFDGNANDSVGSSNWTENGGVGYAGGQVVFDGVDDYLSLTSTPLPTSGSATIEVWGTYDPATAPGSRIFDFSTANGDFYHYLSPNATTQGTRVGWDDDLNNGDSEIGPNEALSANTGSEVLLTVVLNLNDDAIQLYQNGVFVAEDEAFGLQLLSLISGTNDNRLGHGVSNTVPSNPDGEQDPPAFLTGSINEFRIYSGALSSSDILTNAVSGPDVTSVSFGNKTWNAGASDWNSGANWTAAGVPTSTDNATIGNGGTASVTAATPDVGAVNVSNGTLSVGSGGSVRVIYPIQTGAGSSISVSGGGELSTSGVLGSGSLDVDNGTLRASGGTMAVEESVAVNINGGGASIDTQGGIVSIAGELAGTGDIHVSGGGTVRVRDDINLSPGLQHPNFSGAWHVDNSVIDIRGTHGALGTGKETAGSTLSMEDSTLLINTGVSTSVFFKRLPVDIEFTGDDNEIINTSPFDNTFLLQGSLTGDGTVRYTVPFSPEPIGLDFQDRENQENADAPFVSDNSGFTGRFIVDDDTATRFFSSPITDEQGTVIGVERMTDFPNAIFEMAGDGAWTGKRTTDEDQVIQLGGIAGVGPDEDLQQSSAGAQGFGSRFEAIIAGELNEFIDVTYELGGASEDAEFFGVIRDSPIGDTVGAVTIVKVGNNTQALSGPNTYSGTTTVDGGTLLINGTHTQAITGASTFEGDLNNYDGLPVGDYTVNPGGTLGGNGEIGSGADQVNVTIAGGTLAPGASVGTLTVNGNVTLDAGSTFLAEVSGTTADLLDVTGQLNLAGNETLEISLLGAVTPGDYVIAEYGSISGVFDNVPSGYAVAYENGQIIVTVTDTGNLLPGDYNEDGVVDAGDYVVWRDNVGSTDALPNDNVGGTIGPGQYTQWRNNLGMSSAALQTGRGSVAAVPEPASFLLLACSVGAILSFRYSRKPTCT